MSVAAATAAEQQQCRWQHHRLQIGSDVGGSISSSEAGGGSISVRNVGDVSSSSSSSSNGKRCGVAGVCPACMRSLTLC